MLELQRELSTGIARQVRLRLSPERLTALAPPAHANREAYDLYLRGRHLWNQLTPEDEPTRRRVLPEATKLDPDFALAWAGLADIYSASPINSDARPLEVAQRARDAGERAVASGPDLAETQTALGTVITGSIGTGPRRKRRSEKRSPSIQLLAGAPRARPRPRLRWST